MGVLFAGVVNDLQLGEHHQPNRVAFFVKDFLKKDFFAQKNVSIH